MGLFSPAYFAPAFYMATTGARSVAVSPSTPVPVDFYAPVFFSPGYFGGLNGTRFASTVSIPYFERDLIAFLASTSGLKVYPGHIPQKAPLPALSFFLISEDHGHRLSGGAGFTEADYQITIGSRSYIDVGRISQQLRTALQGYRGLMGSTQVFTVLAGPQLSQYQAAVDGSDKGVHSKVCEFEFHYRESIPRS